MNSDPYIRAQIEAKAGTSVLKIKLLNMRSAYPEGLIVAVEGDEDKLVYSRWIARLVPDLKYEFFVCKGKRGARQLKTLLVRDVNELSKDIKIIVDRDFDDLDGFLDVNNVFMLERYSFENFLVDPTSLDNVIRVALPIDGFIELRRAICEIFHADLANFQLASAGVNRRVFLARRLKIDIDSKIPKSLTQFCDVRFGGTSTIDHDCCKLIEFEMDEDVDMSEFISEFDKFDPLTRHRGKFLFKFFNKWLDDLADKFLKKSHELFHSFDGDGKVLYEAFHIGSLANLSPMPEGFEDFLVSR